MKKLFSLLVIVNLCLTGYYAQGQTCRLHRDSIIAGQGTSTFSVYQYDDLTGRLGFVYQTDSAQVGTTDQYNLLYTGNDLTEIRAFQTVGTPLVVSQIFYTYTGGKISQVEVVGDTATAQPWSMTHSVHYNGSDLQSILFEDSTGNPKGGFAASFIDFTWANGNITGFSLLLGSDTIEIVTTMDDKNNIFKKILNREGATYLFQAASANNILTATLVHDEVIMGGNFNAGTALLDNDYTYNSNNDVETMTQNPTPFNQHLRTTQFIYDCSSGIMTPAPATAISIYPNPTTDYIRLENESFRGTVKVFDITGKAVLTENISTTLSSLDVRTLKPGVYYVEMTNNNQVFKGKFLKN